MRAKLQISTVIHGPGYEQLLFNAVMNGTKEDNTYSQCTPSAELNITVTNPELFGQFKPGQKFYVDFTPAE